MAIRDFDAEISTDPREEPVQFKLFKRTWECVDDVNGKRLLDLAALLDGDSVREQRDAVLQVFTEVLDSTERETGATLDDGEPETTSDIDEFMEILDDPKTKIPLGVLVEVTGYLVEQYTDRPTGQPARSQNGHATRGRTSTAGRGAKASTSGRSRQRST
jgi:hypothetical protein